MTQQNNFLSPTVEYTASLDKEWFVKNGGGLGNGIDPDCEGDNEEYDREGYSIVNGEDRAGFTASEYLNAPPCESGLTLRAEVAATWKDKNIVVEGMSSVQDFISRKADQIRELETVVAEANALIADTQIDIARLKSEVRVHKAMR